MFGFFQNSSLSVPLLMAMWSNWTTEEKSLGHLCDNKHLCFSGDSSWIINLRSLTFSDFSGTYTGHRPGMKGLLGGNVNTSQYPSREG